MFDIDDELDPHPEAAQVSQFVPSAENNNMDERNNLSDID